MRHLNKLLLGLIFLGLVFGLNLNAAAPDVRTVCASGCNFTGSQAALDAVIASMNSACDHVGIVLLRAGVTHALPATLDFGAKTCDRQLILQTDAYRSLPNRRINPADSPLLAKLAVSPSGYSITMGCFLPGARGISANCENHAGVKNILIRGIEIEPTTNAQANWSAILLGEHISVSLTLNAYANVQRWEYLPSNITVDQVYIHNPPGILMSSAVKVNGSGVRVTRSYFDDIIYPNDSQAVGVVAARDLLIENNYMSVSGESVLVGGGGPGGSSEPTVSGERNNLMIRGNFSFKNPKLYTRTAANDPPASPVCYEGSYWQNTVTTQWWKCTTGVWGAASAPPFLPGTALMKNHFETKDGTSQILGNVAIGGWTQAQQGQCVHVTTPFAAIANANAESVVVGNFCLGTGGFLTSLGGRTVWNRINSVTAHDNLAVGMWHPDAGTGAPARMMVSGGAQKDFLFRNNTLQSANPGSFLTQSDDREIFLPGFAQFKYNAIGALTYGFFGSGLYDSYCNLTAFQDAISKVDVGNNAVVGSWTLGDICARPQPGLPHPHWPANTTTLASDSALWTNPAGGNYTIKSTLTAARNASANGKDYGADIPFVLALIANVQTGLVDPPRFKLKSALKSGGNLIVYYNAPNLNACTVTASAVENFSSSAGTVSQTRIGLAGVATISGLTSKQWFVRVACGALFDDVKTLL